MDFGFESGAVGLFEYSRDVVAFEEGYLEEVREFDKIQKHTRGFGLLNLSQTDYARVSTAGSESDPSWTRESTSTVLRQQNWGRIRVEACPAFAASQLSYQLSAASVAQLAHFVLPRWAEPPQHL